MDTEIKDIIIEQLKRELSNNECDIKIELNLAKLQGKKQVNYSLAGGDTALRRYIQNVAYGQLDLLLTKEVLDDLQTLIPNWKIDLVEHHWILTHTRVLIFDFIE